MLKTEECLHSEKIRILFVHSGQQASIRIVEGLVRIVLKSL